MPKLLNNLSSWTASVARLGRGLRASSTETPQPALPVILYEYESCPFCRKVREVLSEMDLEYICRPAARGSRNRAELVERGGKSQVPYLVDPNSGVEMYESEDIITYLCRTYGVGRSGFSRFCSPFNTLGSGITSAIRRKGGHVQEGLSEHTSEDYELLVLFNFEASPYCRKVRETLAELDLNYHVKNVAKKSARRPELVARGGKMQVPYLIDPNTGTELYESDDIVAYLHDTYGAST